jgi:hypothetical protein
MRWVYRSWAYATATLLPAAFALLLLVPGDWRTGVAWLAWAHPVVYFMHQIEEHAWPGGFKHFVNQRVFGITDRDVPLDDRAIFWINVPLTWGFFPLAALLLEAAPACAAGCFAVSLVNGILHCAGVLRFGGYNPGLVTGATLLIPVGWTGYTQMHAGLSSGEAFVAWGIAIGGHAAIVGYALLALRRANASEGVPMRR